MQIGLPQPFFILKFSSWSLPFLFQPSPHMFPHFPSDLNPMLSCGINLTLPLHDTHMR